MSGIFTLTQDLYKHIVEMNTDQMTLTIALLTILISTITFFYGKRFELNQKNYDYKRENYKNIIQIYSDIIKISDDPQKRLLSFDEKFDGISSLIAIYGSRSVYRKYIFFSTIDKNPLVSCCHYYKDEEKSKLKTYILSEIFMQMRKEMGYKRFRDITYEDVKVMFMGHVGDNSFVCNEGSVISYKLRMIKLELFLMNAVKFVHINALFQFAIRPITGVIIILFRLLLYCIVRLVKWIFPNADIEKRLNGFLDKADKKSDIKSGL